MGVALITGASGGIGLEIARRFAMDKHDVVLVARREDKLKQIQQEFQEEYGVTVHTYCKDLSRLSDVESLYQEIRESGMTIDFLINNAGVGDYGPFIETDWEKNLQMIQLNVVSVVYLTRQFLIEMVERGEGRIMNVASNAAFQPGPLMAVYFATKAFVLHFSEAIGFENRDSGVTVTTFCPGPTTTDFTAAASSTESRLYKGKKLPSASEVSRYGYKVMMKGRSVAIYGWWNKLQAQTVRISPRKVALWIVHRMAAKRL